MKNCIYLLAFLITSINCFASPVLQAVFSYSVFYYPDKGPYIETYLLVKNNSCVFTKNQNGKYNAKLKVDISFLKDSNIVYKNSYEVLSPEIADTNLVNDNFIDIKRFPMNNGEYKFELKICDLNHPHKTYSNIDYLKVEVDSTKTTISDIELVESFQSTNKQNILSKSGIDIYPKVINKYSPKENNLRFYAEIYNSNTIKKRFIIKSYVQRFSDKLIFENLVKTKVDSIKKVNVIFSDFDITLLTTDDYELVVEARDSTNELIASNKIFFRRDNNNNPDVSTTIVEKNFSNEIEDEKTLNYYIDALYPIANADEYSKIRALLKVDNIKKKQDFFYTFWLKRNQAEPEKSWEDYHKMLIKVDANYGCPNKRGYQTERGRVYLKYGPPNTIYTSEMEPTAYPYEIWHYYNITNQSNVRFIFYNPQFITNCWDLLHSEANGELKNRDWENMLYRKDIPWHLQDNAPTKKFWGEKAEDYFKMPR